MRERPDAERPTSRRAKDAGTSAGGRSSGRAGGRTGGRAGRGQQQYQQRAGAQRPTANREAYNKHRAATQRHPLFTFGAGAAPPITKTPAAPGGISIKMPAAGNAITANKHDTSYMTRMADRAVKKAQRQADAYARATNPPTDTRDLQPSRPQTAGMSKGQLYAWHKANGTMHLYYAMFPDERPGR